MARTRQHKRRASLPPTPQCIREPAGPLAPENDQRQPSLPPETPIENPPSSQQSLKAQYATVSNPIHKYVEGVKRGNMKQDILRTKALPKAIVKSRESTRRFNREMQGIIIRCERLAAQTGCWLYITSQHVNANKGFYNYASPRLRRDGKDQLINIQNTVNVMYSTITDAQRREAVELSLENVEVNQQLCQVKGELLEKNARIAQLEELLT